MSERTRDYVSQLRAKSPLPTVSKLAYFANRKPANRPLLSYEKSFINQICTLEQPWSPRFRDRCLDAVRIAGKKLDWELMEIILNYGTPQCLLSCVNDMLYLLLTDWLDPSSYMESDEDMNHVRFLIRHGAKADYTYSGGQTLLSVCCSRGYHRTFEVLVAAGANPHALYQRHPDSSYHPPESPRNLSKPVNLLQYYLHYEVHRLTAPSTTFWSRRKWRGWGKIPVILLQAGLEVDRTDPVLALMLYEACFRGNIQLIQLLIGIGVDVNSSLEYFIDEYSGALPLQATVLNGRKKCAAILISYGADVQRKATYKDGVEYSPIKACLLAALHLHTRVSIECVDVCNLLVEAGASQLDAAALLEECIQQGNMETIAYLWDLGARIHRVPIMPLTPSYDNVVKSLMERGVPCDPVQQCQRALESEDLEWIERLTNQYGTELIVTNMPLLHDSMYSRSDDSPSNLNYLVSQHGFNINMTFLVPGSRAVTNLLACACEGAKLPAVQILIDLGATIDCPGTPYTAFDFLGKGKYTGIRFNHRELDVFKLMVKSVHDRAKPATDIRETMHQLIAVEKSERPRDFSHHSDWKEPDDGSIARLRRVDHAATHKDDCKVSVSEAQIGLTPIHQTTRRFQHSVLTGLLPMRVICIHPAGLPCDPIICDIINTNLYDQPDFDVLSFDRASEGERNCSIQINDGFKMVSEVLWSALSRIRDETRPAIIYVYELCVDESNDAERSQQKDMLRSIYGEASQLRIYLGKISDLEKREGDKDEIGKYIDGYNGEHPHDYELLEEEDEEYDSYAGENVDLDIVNHAWFSQPRSYLELRIIHSVVYFRGCDEIYLEPRDVQDVDDRGLPVIWDTLQLLRIEPSVQIDCVVNGDMHITSIDIRDDIFDILLLLGGHSVEIDYSKPASFILKEFTKLLFKAEGLLIPLYQTHEVVTHSMGIQPSWIPNYRLMGHHDRADTTYNGARSDIVSCSRLRFEGDDMIVDGLPLGKIEEVGSILHTEPSDLEITEVLRSWESVAVNATINESVKNLTNRFFTAIMADLNDDTSFQPSPGHQIPEDESRTCVHALDQVVWYQKFGTGVLQELDPTFFSEIEAYCEWIGGTADPLTFDRMFRAVGTGNRFFRTNHGIMGLACAEAQKDDEIAFLTGSKYPFIVRRAPSDKGEMKYKIVGNCYGPMDIITWESKKGLKAPDPPQYQEFIIC